MPRKFSGSNESLRERLKQLGFEIIQERKVAYGFQFTTVCQTKIILYHNKTLLFQGPNPRSLEQAWENQDGADMGEDESGGTEPWGKSPDAPGGVQL